MGIPHFGFGIKVHRNKKRPQRLEVLCKQDVCVGLLCVAHQENTYFFRRCDRYPNGQTRKVHPNPLSFWERARVRESYEVHWQGRTYMSARFASDIFFTILYTSLR